MTQTCEGPPRGESADGPDAICLSSSSAAEFSIDGPPRTNTQAENDPARITCVSMRADELRGCLVREISRTMAIGLQAQAALLDGDDDAAIANLRRHWIATRTVISPLAAELRDLRKEPPP
jgi:hypothetical protein